jgi:hypothetical protein
MPEFIPQHADLAGADDFLRGYLTAAEWLLDEEIDRDAVIGWAPHAVADAAEDCKAFQEANAADLAEYARITGRAMESAGIDFWLSRNGHGAGYFDRGNGAVFDRLQDAARVWSSRDVWLGEDGLLSFE